MSESLTYQLSQKISEIATKWAAIALRFDGVSSATIPDV